MGINIQESDLWILSMEQNMDKLNKLNTFEKKSLL